MAETASLLSLVAFVAELLLLLCCYAAGTAVGVSLGGLYVVVEALHLVPGTGGLTSYLEAYLAGVTDAASATSASRTLHAAADMTCSNTSSAPASSLLQAAACRVRQGFYSSLGIGPRLLSGSSKSACARTPDKSPQHAADTIEELAHQATDGRAQATLPLAGAVVTRNQPQLPAAAAAGGNRPLTAGAAGAGLAAPQATPSDRPPTGAVVCEQSASQNAAIVPPLLPVSSSALDCDGIVEKEVPSQPPWGSAVPSPVQPGHVEGHHPALQDALHNPADQEQQWQFIRGVQAGDHPPKVVQEDQHLRQQPERSNSATAEMQPRLSPGIRNSSPAVSSRTPAVGAALGDLAGSSSTSSSSRTPAAGAALGDLAGSSSSTSSSSRTPAAGTALGDLAGSSSSSSKAAHVSNPGTAGCSQEQALGTAAANIGPPAAGQAAADAAVAGNSNMHDDQDGRGVDTAAVTDQKEVAAPSSGRLGDVHAPTQGPTITSNRSSGNGAKSNNHAISTVGRDQALPAAAAAPPLRKDTAAALSPNLSGEGVKTPDSRPAGRTDGGRSSRPGCFGAADGTMTPPAQVQGDAPSHSPAGVKTKTQPRWLQRLRRAFH